MVSISSRVMFGAEGYFGIISMMCRVLKRDVINFFFFFAFKHFHDHFSVEHDEKPSHTKYDITVWNQANLH